MTETTNNLYNVARKTIEKDLFYSRVIGVDNFDSGVSFEVYDGWEVIGRVSINGEDLVINLPWWRDYSTIKHEMVSEDDTREILLSVFEGF